MICPLVPQGTHGDEETAAESIVMHFGDVRLAVRQGEGMGAERRRPAYP